MNYPSSLAIRLKVKNAKHILVNCHQNPDVDSISSALAMCQALSQLGKKVTIICPSYPLPELNFLPCYEHIQKVDFDSFDFDKFDLFLVLDSASPEVVTGSKEISFPAIHTIVIDHHKTNTKFGDENLIDTSASAATELLYLLFLDWRIHIEKDIATTLLTGILGDTGAFEYHNTTPKTLQIAAELMEKGADKDEILLRIFRTKKLNLLKFWGEVLDKLEVDTSGKFTWCAIPYDTFKRLGKPQTARESASSQFIRMVEGTDFGLVILEEEPGVIKVSFRSRGDFDVSRIAQALGGGGHKGAAGLTLTGLNFRDAVKKVVAETEKYING